MAGWTKVLSGNQLRKIRGTPNFGPFVAGDDLWQCRGEVWRAGTVQGSRWISLSLSSTQTVWGISKNGGAAQLHEKNWRDSQVGGWPCIDICGWENDAWVTATHNYIYRFADDIWTLWQPPALEGHHVGAVWGVAPDNVWVHAARRTNGEAPDMAHWDGQQWTLHPLKSNGYGVSLHGVTAQDIWLVGLVTKWIGKGPLAAHWDGTEWKEIALPTRNKLLDVFAANGHSVWFSGMNGTLIHYDGEGFQTVNAPTGHIDSVYEDAAGQVWVIVNRSEVWRMERAP